MKKRLLALLLTFVLVLSIVPQAAFAASGSAAEAPQMTAEPVREGAKAGEGLTVLAFTSDVHNKSGNVAANRLGSWIDKMNSNDYYGTYGGIEVMAFGGDMSDANASATSFWTLAQADMDQLDQRNLTGVYTTGNHEHSPGRYSASSTNATQQKYKINTQGAEGDNYRIYCLGSASSSSSYSSQISSLTSYLNSIDNSKPIFIITHFPLHYAPRKVYNERITDAADQMIEAINAAVESKDHKIVFLWGHNHTESDDHYDQIYKPGDTISYDKSGNSKQIQFYYGAAGCMSDYEYGSGSQYVRGKGLIVTINSKKQLSFTYYDAEGNKVTENGENGSYTEQDPTPVESASITETAPTVEVGRSITLHYTVSPGDATISSVTWTSADSGVATVDQNGRVKGVSVGRTTITASISDGITRNTVNASVQIEVTERTSQEDYFVITIGDYALSSKACTDYMTNSDGYEYHGLQTYAYDPDEPAPTHILWTLEESEDGSGYYVVSYDGAYLSSSYVSNGVGSTGRVVAGETKEVWIPNNGIDTWQVSGSTLQSTASSTSSKTLYLSLTTGNNNEVFFTVRSTTTVTAPDRTTILSAPDSIQQPVPVTGVTLDKAAITIEAGRSSQLTAAVQPANADNKNVTWSSSNGAVATVDKNGKVKAVAVGETTITVTTEEGGYAASCTVTVKASTSVEPRYVISIEGYALSTTAETDYHPESNGQNKYYGYKGVAYDGSTDPDDSILWYLEEADGGYYIKSMDGEYLSATYVTTTVNYNNVITGHLNLGTTKDIWTLAGSLEDWILSGSKLHSTNSDKYLAFETVGAAGNVNMFTIRSENNADSSTASSPDIELEVRYEETNALRDGREYIIAVTKDSSSVYAVNNVATGTTATNIGSATLTITPAIGSDPAYIATDEAGVVWKYASSNQYMTNRNLYLNYGYSSSNRTPQAATSGRAIAYTNNMIRIGSSTYLTCSNGSFGCTTTSGSGATVRLFEKKVTIVENSCTHKWSGPEWNWTDNVTKSRAASEPAATATFTCSECGAVEVCNAAIATDNTVSPVKYTATVTGPDGETYTDIAYAKAEAGEYTITLTADPTDSAPGKEVEFTITLSAVDFLGSMYFELDLPAGLSFVKGELAEGLAETLGFNPDLLEFFDNGDVIGIYGGAVEKDYSSQTDTVLGTFKCTVDDTFTSGTLSATLKSLEIYSFNEEEYTAHYKVIPGTVTVTPLTVTFYKNYEGADPASTTQTVYKNVADKLDANNFTRTGYTFKGWNTAADGTGTDYANGADITLTENLTLYAQWEAGKVTVTFNANGHGTAPDAQTVEYNETATEPTPAPTAEGYTFGGWYTEAACTNAYSFSTPVTGDITLYAKWTLVEYTITYNENDGTMPADAVTSYTIEDAVTLPRPTREGYGFGGWFDNASFSGTAVENIPVGSTGNKTFYAKWTAGEYSITYVLNGGTLPEGTANPGSYTIESAEIVLPSPVKEDYTFAGWFDNADFSGTAVTGIAAGSTGDKTFYAKWTINTYTVTFNTNGHGTVPDAQTVEYNATAAEPTPAPTADGYTFGGWYTEAACTNAYSFSTLVTGDITLYAKWTINTYTVTFNANGHGTVPDAQTVEYNATATEPTPAPTADGYTFGGWYTEAACTNAYNFSTLVTGDITLYAKWTPTEYTITYNLDGGTLPEGTANPGSYTIESAKIVLPRPVKEGYYFEGWFTSQTGGVEFLSIAAGSTGDKNFYARWTELVCKVEVTPANSTVVPGDEVTFTVSIGPVVHMGTMEMTLDIPDGLTYVMGSGALCEEQADQLKNKLGFDQLDWTETEAGDSSKLVLRITGAGDTDYTGTDKVQILTFRCKVENTFTGPKNVTVKNCEFLSVDEYNKYGELGNYTSSYTIDNAVVNEKAKYTVEFKNGTTVLQTGSVYIGNVPAYTGETPTKAADAQYTYTFSGWSSDNGTTVYGPDEALPAVTGDVTYVAQFSTTVNTYTVTFNAHGHGTAPAAQTVEYNATATEPTPAPNADGYTFGGWYADETLATEFDFTAGITQNTTVYAKWTANIYTVAFDKNDAEAEGTMANQSFTYDAEQKLTKNAFIKDNYTFAGWNTAADGTGTAYADEQSVKNLTVESGATVTLYAQWTQNAQVTITFNKNAEDATGTMADQTIYSGVASALNVNAFARTGYTFAGWAANADAAEAAYADGATVTFTENTALYAVWTVNSYTITWNMDDGSLIDTTTVAYGAVPTHAAPTKAATAQYTYTFAGWSDGTTTYEADKLPAVTGSATYTAVFTQTVNKYTVTFVDEDGTTVILAAAEYDYGTAWASVVKPSDPAKIGYTFAGWTGAPETVTENVTVKASYTAVEYTITYNLDGGTLPADAPVKYTIESDAITLPTPTKDGYTFAGWFDNEDLEGTAVTTIAKGSTGNKVFWAKWEETSDEGSYVMSFGTRLEGQLSLRAFIVFTEKVLKDSAAYIQLSYTYAETPKNPTLVTEKPVIADAATDTQPRTGIVRRVFSNKFFIAQLNDEVNIKLFNGSGKQLPLSRLIDGEYVDMTETGVIETPWSYLERYIAIGTDANMKDLARAIEYYGTAAQLQFDYHTDLIPEGAVGALNEAIGREDIDTKLARYEEKTTGTLPAGITKYTKNLTVESDHSLVYQFQPESGASITDYRFWIDSGNGYEEVEATINSNGRFCIRKSNIASGELSKTYKFKIAKVGNESNAFEITASALSYAYAVTQNTSVKAELKTLARALYLYSYAADKYFETGDFAQN